MISGDAPATVAAIAADAGIPVRGAPVDGRELPAGDAELLELVRTTNIVGRISPDGKRRYVEALALDGSHVVMVGDGVNDVPALKAARLAIAQGAGSQMARGVADLVLVKGGFASIPPMIREGRKVLRNLQRVAKLFVAKSVVAAFLILTVGLSAESYPFLPRHLTLASAITIGIPAFFLALAPSNGAVEADALPARAGQLRRYPPARRSASGWWRASCFSINLLGMDDVRARTVATTVLVAMGLYLIVVLESSSACAATPWGPVPGALRPLRGRAVAARLARVLRGRRAGRGHRHVLAGGTALAAGGLGSVGRALPPGVAQGPKARAAARINARVTSAALVTHHAQIASMMNSSA